MCVCVCVLVRGCRGERTWEDGSGCSVGSGATAAGWMA